MNGRTPVNGQRGNRRHPDARNGIENLGIEVGNAFRFFHQFLRNPSQVGAIAPSSEVLARAMVRDLDLQPGQSVLELGPGTGSLTVAIREILPLASSYIGIECDSQFVQLLQSKFPDLCFVVGWAEHAHTICLASRSGSPRAVISGLPFASLNGPSQRAIIRSLKKTMEPGSEFRTFQYAHAYNLPSAVKFRNLMGRVFGQHQRSRVVLRNLPPAFVLSWRMREHFEEAATPPNWRDF